MTYTITWRGRYKPMAKTVTLRSFAEMVLWASDPKWQWTVGKHIGTVLYWIETAPGFRRDAKGRLIHLGTMRWRVTE